MPGPAGNYGGERKGGQREEQERSPPRPRPMLDGPGDGVVMDEWRLNAPAPLAGGEAAPLMRYSRSPNSETTRALCYRGEHVGEMKPFQRCEGVEKGGAPAPAALL